MMTSRDDVVTFLNDLFANSNVPCRVQHTTYGGLGMFASRRILAGEVVLHERPLLLTIERPHESHVCAHCLARSQHGRDWDIVFRNCDRVRYCSSACQASHQHTDLECAALANCDADDDAVDLVTQAIAALALRAREGELELLPGVVVGFSGYDRLCGIRRTQRNGAVIKRAVVSALKAIAPPARVPAKELFAVLDRHQANVYGVTGPGNADLALASFVGAFHLFNHSCLPNLVFDSLPRGREEAVGGCRPRFALVALTEVEEGDELVHCYASSAEGPRARRSYLEDHYGFVCSCRRCLSADADLEQEAELTLRLEAMRCGLPGCGSGLGFPIGGEWRQCVHCGGTWEADGRERDG